MLLLILDSIGMDIDYLASDRFCGVNGKIKVFLEFYGVEEMFICFKKKFSIDKSF